jgi:signal transduction histidine kinase/ligand-binding sensor domain-containing protein/DNA-binding response OmpR family regulator
MIRRITILLLFMNQLAWSQNSKLYFDNFTTDNGLSDNYVNCILQDTEGWIWIGAGMGISRFDGIKFKSYPVWISDSLEIEDFIVRNYFVSRDGTQYACAEEVGLAVYNRKMDRFERLLIDGKPVLSDISVKDLVEDVDGNLWAATKNGIFKIDLTTGKLFNYSHDERDKNSLIGNYVRKLVFDSYSRLWIATSEGLDMFDPADERFTHYSEINHLLDCDIVTIYLDAENRILVGTYFNGMVIIDLSGDRISSFIPDPFNDRSYNVYAIHRDRSGVLWIGTRGGIYLCDENHGIISWIKKDIHEDRSLIHNSIMGITEDAKGDMWIGTRSGLSYMVKEKQVFGKYIAIPNNNLYLNNSEVYCIWIDETDKIWMGTENGGVNILDRKKGEFTYLTESDGGLSNNCIKSIQRIGEGKVLIGTYLGGLNLYNLTTGEISIFKHDAGAKNSISGNKVWDIEVDNMGQAWIATESGLDRFDPATGSFTHYPEFDDMSNGIRWIFIDNENDIWLGAELTRVYRPGSGIISSFNESFSNLFEDSSGRYWATGARGIVLYDKYKGALKVYNEKDGIACNLTYCILEDDYNHLWISTMNGLSCLDPGTGRFRNYHSIDGLQGNQFHYGAALKSDKGELFFGGKDGLTMFNPVNIIENQYIPPVYITDLKIFNAPVKISAEKDAILKQSITKTEYLEIPYKYNVLTFEFAGLNYTNSGKNRHKYILEGFDSEWTETSENRNATYTNLDPGEYVFRVTASNNNEYWNEQGTSLTLRILPPFYKTFWFISLMVLMVSGLISLVFYVILKRKELTKAYEFEKIKAQKLHELDSFKLNLFTNISHEIKTPLTLIISPLSKILKADLPGPEIKEHLLVMEKNARHLMKLITQLLDYRKFQDGKLKIELKKGDMVSFCRNIFMSFEDVMNEKNIVHKFGSVQNKIMTSFDPDKLRSILNNLVSNAVRYSKQGGSITFFISMVIEQDRELEANESRYIKIAVKDTGVGISGKELPRIFNRYYSKASQQEIHSTGIGLAFARELIELHKGKIFVESKEGKGSTFTVLLPFIEEEAEIVDEFRDQGTGTDDFTKINELKITGKDKKILLVVEDNNDVLQFIGSHFKEDFTVLSASNGKDGLDLALRTIPDIIVSDIMMPGLDGRELCGRIKKDERTSHIPVILLTALSSKENEKEGLLTGADDYMTKPFDIDLLQTKIGNLLMMRKSLKDKYTKMMLLRPSHVEFKTLDEKFIEKAIRIIEKNIDDPDLNIDRFVSQIGVSRMQLYRKIDALTNMTVKEFINDIRLKRAEQILSEKKTSITEVAYSVGFSDLSYFGKCFKRKYGMSPSEYYQQRNVNLRSN